MAATAFNGNGYRMGPRIRVRTAEPTHEDATLLRSLGPVIAARTECDPDHPDCEAPAVKPQTVIIALSVVIPIVAIMSVLYYLHRRGIKKQRMEEASDPTMSLDFGINDDKMGRGGKRKSVFREKMLNLDHKHRAQVSMDMNLSSPYLLPPALQGSKQSLHSLARNLHDDDDPYRPVNQYGSEVGSIRSYRPEKEGRAGSSVYTGSTERGSSLHSSTHPPRQNSLPKPPPLTADPFATPTGARTPQLETSPISPTGGSLPHAIIPEIGTVSYAEDFDDSDRNVSHVPDVTQPAPVAQRDARRVSSGASQPSWNEPAAQFPDPAAHQVHNSAPTLQSPVLPEIGVGLGLHEMNFEAPPQTFNGLPSGPAVHKPDQAGVLPAVMPDGPMEFDDRDGPHGQQSQNYADYEQYEERGRSTQRRSMRGNFRESRALGLGVPQQDNKRLSVGLRPLPPNEVMEFEDPEERANRIRSFYKEYFDDSKPPGEHNMPPPHHQQGGPQYYEDYDAGYGGGNDAFYDPASNSFVMPYAQPVTRRAMTPPPSGSRLRGPPSRGVHGSIGGMNMPRGRQQGPHRAGTTMSNGRGGTPARPGSSLSSAYGQPRPGSSVSNKFQRQPKPKGPPPTALTTLPNPSKLRDDNMALLGAIDFAPPESYEDRQRGRSQSPAGERRPFAPKVPIASPLVSSFEEMAAIPSPHLLRKSSTFTALDFAPPRKFQNEDNMSDAGSIRSNRSGISAVQAHAIRSGAGRVSRLPGDTVFTQASLETTLKPSWGMRT
ncbi:hypothetical protein BN1708_001763 [Verticillium longisporum]|uniref:Uncharacterized protein n=1 Tax=Verticillium longisporum TaxID=100787 RepID=A0A0G4N4L0_VERLO|nr:hypothetical protein BN1708_001763 [Verticillium longisporum]